MKIQIKFWKGKYEINTNFTFWQKGLVVLSSRAGLFLMISSIRHPTPEKGGATFVPLATPSLFSLVLLVWSGVA
jgi:hypothetical protein